MKKRFNIKPVQLFALIVVLFASFSCKDSFFEEQNGERITPDQHYKSINDVETSLMGVIIPLQKVMPNYIMIDGLRSDQMIVTPNAEPFLVDINNQVLSLDNPYLDASDYYKVIINCNEAYANFDKVTKLDRNYNEFFLKYTKAGLISVRSWVYLQLVRIYGEAALITDNLTGIPANLEQTMLTKDVMIDTLINQLLPTIPTEDQLTNMPELWIDYYTNGKAVLGELYLEKGDYPNAVKYLKLAAESYGNNASLLKVDGFKLDAWRSIFQNAESQITENIAVIPYNHQQGQYNPLPKWFLPTDQFMIKPSQLLVDSFKTQVPAKGPLGDYYRAFGPANTDTVALGATLDSTAFGEAYINKYSVNKIEPYSSDIIISRAADIHLMLAEALNRNGDQNLAMALVNDGLSTVKPIPAAYTRWNKNIGVRGRAYLAKKVVPDSLAVINGEDTTMVALQGQERVEYVEDLIMNERALELAFEGKRWFDLMRIANRRNNPAYLADKVAAKFTDPGQREAVRSRLLNRDNWFIPFKN